MSSNLFEKIYNFLVNAPQEHITAVSVIYQGIEEEPWITKTELRDIVTRAITSASSLHGLSSPQTLKLLQIPLQVSSTYNFLYIRKRCMMSDADSDISEESIS